MKEEIDTMIGVTFIYCTWVSVIVWSLGLTFWSLLK